MQTPDPSPLPDPADQAGAIAAMRREWEELRAQIAEWPAEWTEDETSEEGRRRAELLRDFFARHRATLFGALLHDEQIDLVELRADLERFLHSDASYRDPEEKLLQMTAIKAEQEQGLAILSLGHLASLLEIPPEEWEAMSEEEREPLETVFAHYRAKRESLLSVLPIELRREWEARLGPE